MAVPFLGRIPIDPAIARGGDAGEPFTYHLSKSETGKRFAEMVERLIYAIEGSAESMKEEKPSMHASICRYAVPIAAGQLCAHFGHCK